MFLLSKMSEQMSKVAIPTIPYYYNLAIFPSPLKGSPESRFFILKKSADIPRSDGRKWLVDYIPGYIYCLLPSDEKTHGLQTVYDRRPQFLERYSYCLEIDRKEVIFPNENVVSEDKSKADDTNIAPCKNCFVSHFPRPNKMSCKFAMKKKKLWNSFSLAYRLRGGAGDTVSDPIIENAISNAKAHGIDVHAGVRNLGNGNCAFESVLDSINT